MATLPVDKTASTPNWKKWQSVDMASSVLSTALGGVHAPSAGPLTSSTDLMQQGAARSEQAALHAFASAVLHFTARSMANAAVEERQEAAAELSVPNGPAEASSDGNEVGTKGIHSGRQESTAMPSITVQADCRPASGVLPAESMPRADSQLQEAPTNPAQGPHAGGDGPLLCCLRLTAWRAAMSCPMVLPRSRRGCGRVTLHHSATRVPTGGVSAGLQHQWRHIDPTRLCGCVPPAWG